MRVNDGRTRGLVDWCTTLEYQYSFEIYQQRVKNNKFLTDILLETFSARKNITVKSGFLSK